MTLKSTPEAGASASLLPTGFSLAGRVAIVTGASGFLGREHCDALAELGASIVAVDVTADAVAEVADDVARRRDVSAIGVGVDITDRSAIHALADRIERELGRVDVLVNNAQLQLSTVYVPFEELALEDWNRILAVNLTGAFLCCQAFGKRMRDARRGSVVNFGSIYGMRGPDFSIYEGTPFTTAAVYSASKSGIYGLTRYLATYWAPFNVRVNAVTPGGIRNQHTDPFLTAYSDTVPLKRMGERAELRGVVQFLASDASSYVTGQNIPVDGGRTAW